jgi:hypothetical protein
MGRGQKLLIDLNFNDEIVYFFKKMYFKIRTAYLYKAYTEHVYFLFDFTTFQIIEI